MLAALVFAAGVGGLAPRHPKAAEGTPACLPCGDAARTERGADVAVSSRVLDERVQARVPRARVAALGVEQLSPAAAARRRRGAAARARAERAGSRGPAAHLVRSPRRSPAAGRAVRGRRGHGAGHRRRDAPRAGLGGVGRRRPPAAAASPRRCVPPDVLRQHGAAWLPDLRRLLRRRIVAAERLLRPHARRRRHAGRDELRGVPPRAAVADARGFRPLDWQRQRREGRGALRLPARRPPAADRRRPRGRDPARARVRFGAPRSAMKLSIVIPVYNEEQTIGEVVERVWAADLGGIEREVIIANDGSTDQTCKALEESRWIADPRVKRYDCPINLGKGAAVRLGLRVAQGDIMLSHDGQLQAGSTEYGRLLAPILEGRAQIGYGARLLAPSQRIAV